MLAEGQNFVQLGRCKVPMDESLRLEYSCTPKELEEAENLALVKNFGRGSKWLTLAIVALGVASSFFGLYFRVEPHHRPFMLVFFAILVAAVLVYQWWSGKKKNPPMTAEITAQEIRITSGESHVALPWSVLGELVESETLFLLPERNGALVYVLPKRAFPDARSCDWFRNVAGSAVAVSGDELESPQWAPAPAGASGSLILKFRLRYRDYLDRMLASWFTRGAIVFVLVLVLGSFLIASLNPPEDAVHSMGEVFVFMLPFMFVMALMPLLVASTLGWLSHRGTIVEQTVNLTETSLLETSARAQSTVSWQTPTCFKETPWSFVMWWPGTPGWLQLPKRAFPTLDGVDRCREILTANARRSTWYFGR